SVEFSYVNVREAISWHNLLGRDRKVDRVHAADDTDQHQKPQDVPPRPRLHVSPFGRELYADSLKMGRGNVFLRRGGFLRPCGRAPCPSAAGDAPIVIEKSRGGNVPVTSAKKSYCGQQFYSDIALGTGCALH